MRVQNMTNANGNTVFNQFLIKGVKLGTFRTKDNERIAGGDLFQSYASNIAYRDIWGRVYLDATYWDYSRTTGKYRNYFLGECVADTRKKIKSGEYQLTELN